MADATVLAGDDHWANNRPDLWRGGAEDRPSVSRCPFNVVDTTVLELVPIAWTGRNTGDARLRPKPICDSTCKVCCRTFVIIDTAGEHDNKRARELCAGVKSGEIVLV